MADGKGCKCAAYDKSECACDADWTPQELIDARADIERLRLTDAERDAVEWAGRTLCVGWHDLDAADKQRTREAAATLCSLLDRLGSGERTPN